MSDGREEREELEKRRELEEIEELKRGEGRRRGELWGDRGLDWEPERVDS